MTQSNEQLTRPVVRLPAGHPTKGEGQPIHRHCVTRSVINRDEASHTLPLIRRQLTAGGPLLSSQLIGISPRLLTGGSSLEKTDEESNLGAGEVNVSPSCIR